MSSVFWFPWHLMRSQLLMLLRFYIFNEFPSLAIFKILSFFWLSTVWLYDVSRCDSLWVYPMWSFWTSWICRWMFSIKHWNFTGHYFFSYFFLPFSHPLSSWTFSTVVLVNLLVCHWSVRLCSFFIFFSLPQTGARYSSSSQIPFPCSYLPVSSTTDFFHFCFLYF